MPDHAKTDFGSPKTGQGAKIEDVIKVAANAYTEGKNGVLPGIDFGEESEHHRYIFLYALLAIAVGTALVLCLYQIFVRHVVSVYNDDHPEGESANYDSDEDDDEGVLLASPSSSDEDDVKPLVMKRKGLGRSTTPLPGKRSTSASSGASSASKSKGKKLSSKKKK